MSIEYTRDAIRITRQIISETRAYSLEEDFRDAEECAGQAHAYHEESLRRVNGPTHFDLFASSAGGRLVSCSKSWVENNGRQSVDFYGDVPDNGDVEADSWFARK
jgi:hypothetical protein